MRCNLNKFHPGNVSAWRSFILYVRCKTPNAEKTSRSSSAFQCENALQYAVIESRMRESVPVVISVVIAIHNLLLQFFDDTSGVQPSETGIEAAMAGRAWTHSIANR